MAITTISFVPHAPLGQQVVTLLLAQQVFVQVYLEMLKPGVSLYWSVSKLRGGGAISVLCVTVEPVEYQISVGRWRKQVLWSDSTPICQWDCSIAFQPERFLE